MASNGDYVVDPVEAVGGVKKSAPVTTMHAVDDPSIKKSGIDVGSVNYIIEVMKYTNIAMEHQADIVKMRGQLEDVVTKMQSDMATISNFLSTMQAKSVAGGFYEGWSDSYGCHKMNANALNGLSPDLYKMDDGLNNAGSDRSTGCVDPSYKNFMDSFVKAVRDLYYASSDGTGPTVSELAKISNPYDSSGKTDFDMMPYWEKLCGSYGNSTTDPVNPGKGYDVGDLTVMGLAPTEHAGLLQQYMYYKAQLTVNGGDSSISQDQVIAAKGDISKLVNFDPMSPDDNLDANISPMLQFLDSLNVSVSADRNYGGCKHVSTDGTVSDNLLKMITTNDPNTGQEGLLNTQLLNVPDFSTQYTPWEVGLYGAFAYAAFDYAFTKNANAATDKQDTSTYYSSDGSTVYDMHFVGNTNDAVAKGDPLSTMYASSNSVQTNFSAAGNQTNSNFQQDVNSVQQIDGAAGKMVDGYSQGQSTSIHNFKTG